MTKIINYKTKETIIENSDLSMKELVEKAVKDKISLAYADSSEADLSKVALRGAKFEGAYLEEANFEGADLSEANFEGANLTKAFLRETDLRGAKIKGADFEGAYVKGLKINKDQVDDLLEALGVKII